MGALHRFFIPEELWDEKALVLRGEEAHHCRNVLRHSEGEQVEVFQGRGLSAVARIRSLRKAEVELDALSVERSEPLAVEVTLAQSVPKGKHMDFIVQKATEIGAARIVPLITERTVVRLEGEAGNQRDKWHRAALEACKQCGRNWIPELAPAQTVEQFLSGNASDWRLVAALSPEARRLGELIRERGAGVSSLAVAIGPEGDFTPEELERFRRAEAGFLWLGPTVLRSDTAAIYALSVISQEMY